MIKKLCLFLMLLLTGCKPMSIDPKVLSIVQHAYSIAVADHYTDQSNYVVIDFSKPSTEERLFLVTKDGTVIYSTYVAHGAGSGSGAMVTKVSNVNGSGASSVGVQVTAEWYTGKHGKVLRVQGLEPGYNDNVYSRYIEVHGADYIGNGKTGHSLGCYAVPQGQIEHLLSLIPPRTLIIVYFPDSSWLAHSKFLTH